MATRQIVSSDIGGDELTDDNHARVVLQHPDNPSALEIDVSIDEAEKFVNTSLRLVNLTIYAPNVPPRTVTMETKVLDKLFNGVDFEAVMAGARKADAPAPAAPRRGRPAKAPSAAASEKRDYTTVEWAGSVKRGKISDGEKATVKAHLDEVNKNLAARGERLIDPNNPEHKEKYGL